MYGNAVIDNNAITGITAGSNVSMAGTENSISNNGESGIAADNGRVTIYGKIFLVHNNFVKGSENALNCLPLDTDQLTSFGHGGGIVANSAVLQDADIIDNCGAGIGTGEFVRIQGRVNIRNNTGNGIQTRNARIAGGTICDNNGYGIRLFGSTHFIDAGTLFLGAVQVCENKLGGIKGKKTTQTSPGKAVGHFILSTAPSSVLSGSSITNNVGNGLEFDSFFPLVISKSNISGNSGLAVKNLDPSTPIMAQGVWWGNASGAGNSISTGVDASGWRSSPVSLTISHSLDSTFNAPGNKDSVSILVQNWVNPSDSVQVTITESHGWLQSPSSVVVTTKDSIPGIASVVVAIPQNALPGDSTIVHITAKSLKDTSATDTDSFVLLAYTARLVRVVLLPDSVQLLKGDSVRFAFSGYDQAGKIFEVRSRWTTTGGSVDSAGGFRAGSTLGLFSLTAQDTITGLSATAKVVIVNSVTDVRKDPQTPTEYSLAQNYPNPFNPTTTIRFATPQRGRVALRVFDILGREVGALVNGELEAGSHQVTFDASKLSSGVYFYRLHAGTFTATKKLVLMK